MSKITLSAIALGATRESMITAINANMVLLSGAIDDTLSRSGIAPNTLTSEIDMNSERIINLPEPLTNTEPVRKGEFDVLQDDLNTAVVNFNITTTALALAEINAAASAAHALTSELNAALSEALTASYLATVNLPTDFAANPLKVLRVNAAGTAWELFTVSSLADGDKGDITVSSGGATWTVDPGAIGTSKLGGDITAAGKALLDDATAGDQRTTLGLGTLATQSGTFSGTSSGINTGDQTSIVGITGTTAQFNTALSDGDFATGGGTATGTNTGDQSLFSTIAVSGQSNVVADAASDTLTLVAGTNVTITTDAATDSITINASGGGGGVSDGDKGDISVTGTGTIWTIDNDAVTYAKVQNVSATDRLLGRSTAGAGDIEEIACTAFARSILDDANAATTRSTLEFAAATTDNAIVRFDGTTGKTQNSTAVLGDSGDLILAPSSSTVNGLSVTQSLSGASLGTGNASSLFLIPSDNAQGGVAFVNGLEVSHTYGGAATTGGRQSIAVYSTLSAATSGSNANRNYVALAGYGTATSGDGGTNTGAGALGAIFGIGIFADAQSGATNLLHVGNEIDVALRTGSSAKHKTGLLVTSHAVDAVNAATTNAGYALSGQPGCIKFAQGLSFTDMGGAAPVQTTGTLIGTSGTWTVDKGVDFSGATVTTSAFKSSGFSVNGSGTTTVKSLLVEDAATPSVNMTVGGAGKAGFQWNVGLNAFLIDTYVAAPTLFRYNSTEVVRVDATGTTLAAGTAIPAGGAAGIGYKFSSTNNFGVFFGSGAPTLSAAKGSVYLRSDASSAPNSLYSNTDGATGWGLVDSGGGGGSPGGSTGEVQYNNAGAFAGAADVEIEGGQLRLPAIAIPAAPAADGLKLFGKKRGGRMMVAIIGPNGIDASLQPHSGMNAVAKWQPDGNSTTITAVGAAALTATGTATAANVATTNRYTYMRRLEYLVTVAATTAVAGFRGATAKWGIGGAAAGDGGFHYVCRWGPATGVATTTNRAFVGMASVTTAPTDVEPSTITNTFGMGWDAADTNIQVMYRGAGAANKVDLGASFPVPTADRTKVYEIALFSPPGTTQSVSYEITDLATGAVATGTITTNLPAATTFLAPRGWMSVGGTSSVIGIALMNLYIETDY